MDKHWMVFRESERKPVGEDFSGRMAGQEGLTERSVTANQWQDRIVRGLTQMFTISEDQIPHIKTLRQDV